MRSPVPASHVGERSDLGPLPKAAHALPDGLNIARHIVPADNLESHELDVLPVLGIAGGHDVCKAAISIGSVSLRERVGSSAQAAVARGSLLIRTSSGPGTGMSRSTSSTPALPTNAAFIVCGVSDKSGMRAAMTAPTARLWANQGLADQTLGAAQADHSPSYSWPPPHSHTPKLRYVQLSS